MSWRSQRLLESPENQPRVYRAEILPLIQALLATLADIDFAHECEMEKLQTGSVDSDVKSRAIAVLQERHRERREPYVRQLAALRDQIWREFGEGELCVEPARDGDAEPIPMSRKRL